MGEMGTLGNTNVVVGEMQLTVMLKVNELASYRINRS